MAMNLYRVIGIVLVIIVGLLSVAAVLPTLPAAGKAQLLGQ